MVTDEKKKKREEEAQAFLREREKLASQQGISSKAAGERLISSEDAKLRGTPQAQAAQELEALRIQNLKEQEMSRQLETTAPPAEIIQIPELPDMRGSFEKLFFPTAEEGAARRMKAFGTESKIPAIAAGVAAGAGAGLLGAALIPAAGATAGGAAAGGGTAAGIGIAASFAKLFTAKSLLIAVGAAVVFTEKELSDSEKALTLSMTGAEQTIQKLRENSMPFEEAQLNLEVAEMNINELERAVKISSVINPRVIVTGASKYKTRILLAKQALARMRTELPVAQQEGRLAKARAGYGL